MRLRLPRFTLRVLLLLVAAVAVVIGWHARELHQRRQAIAHIKAMGGVVLYEHEWNEYIVERVREVDPSYTLNIQPPGPGWLRWLIGNDAFAPVHSVRLSGDQFTDDDVRWLTALKPVAFVNVSKSRITNAGLKEIATLPNLVGLDVSETRISDSGLPYLYGCESLERFTFNGINREAIRELRAALPNLETARIDPDGLHIQAISRRLGSKTALDEQP